MKTIICGLVVAGALVSNLASAAVIKYDYVATLIGVAELDNATGLLNYAKVSTVSGQRFETGQVLRGSLSYDNAAPLLDSTPNPIQPGTVNAFSSPITTDLRIDGTNFSYQNNLPIVDGAILTEDAPAGDGIDAFMTTSARWDPATVVTDFVDFFFLDLSGEAMTDGKLPQSLDLSLFPTSVVRYTYLRLSDDVEMQAFATITLLTQVPEPTSPALVLAALSALALVRRRRSR